MTNIEQKALELVNEKNAECGMRPWKNIYRCSFLEDVVCRAIERHEAFRQEVSDAVEKWDSNWNYRNAPYRDELCRFIITKPDPLVEALAEAGYGSSEEAVYDLRAALAKRGLEIREKSDG